MGVFAQDSFTDTAGTDLISHTPEAGGTWTRHGSYTGGRLGISNANRMRPLANGAADLYYLSADPGTAEYDIEYDDVMLTNANPRPGAAARIDTGANTMYFCRYSTGVWELFKLVSGTATQLGTFNQSRADNDVTAVKLEIRDAAKKVYLNGVERISSTDNAITAAGKAGIREGSATNGSDTGGIHMDNFVATDLAGAAGHPAVRRFGGFSSIRSFAGLRVWMTGALQYG